jgi:hypothetical protein
LFLQQAWKYLSVQALYHFSIIMQQFSKGVARAFSKEAGVVRQKNGLAKLACSAAWPFKPFNKNSRAHFHLFNLSHKRGIRERQGLWLG